MNRGPFNQAYVDWYSHKTLAFDGSEKRRDLTNFPIAWIVLTNAFRDPTDFSIAWIVLTAILVS